MENEIPSEVKELANELSGYWNYRWVKIVVNVPKIDEETMEVVKGETEQEAYYALHEVYYDQKGKPFMWAEEPEKVICDDKKDMLQFLAKVLEASEKKVLQITNNKMVELDEYMEIGED